MLQVAIGCCLLFFILNVIFMSLAFTNAVCTSAGGGLCYRMNYDCGICEAASCKAATPAAGSGTSTYAAEPAATQPAVLNVVGYGSDAE